MRFLARCATAARMADVFSRESFALPSVGGMAFDIGLIDGVANAVAAVVRLFAETLSDRLGRRPLVLAVACRPAGRATA